MKIPFFFAGGTGFLVRDINGPSIDIGFSIRWEKTLLFQGLGLNVSAVMPGINGRTANLILSGDSEDPFPSLLDANVWDCKTINYPASMFGGTGGITMGSSIDYGRDRMIEAITALPVGTKFALGGASQGAAVCSSCYLSGLQPGTTGVLESRRDDFLGYVGFGNPRRQIGYNSFTSWNGTWYDTPSEVTTGGGGAFPPTGAYRRLTNCEPDKWIEFANPLDIYSSNGTTGKGLRWTQAIEVFLTLNLGQAVEYLLEGLATASEVLFAAGDAFGQLAQEILLVDQVDRAFGMPGSGHASYPFMPPPNADGSYNATVTTISGKEYRKSNVDTCAQLALTWLEAKAADYIRSQPSLPVNPTAPSNAGWSTTLIPPAA